MNHPSKIMKPKTVSNLVLRLQICFLRFIYTHTKCDTKFEQKLIFLSAFLRNFFLRQDWLRGDVPPDLAQPCQLALGQALIWGLYPDWFEDFVNWVPLPRLGPAVDLDGVAAFKNIKNTFIY